jgi:hypothetical protein
MKRMIFILPAVALLIACDTRDAGAPGAGPTGTDQGRFDQGVTGTNDVMSAPATADPRALPPGVPPDAGTAPATATPQEPNN